MMKRQSLHDTVYSIDDVHAKRILLEKMMETGVLTRAYIKIAGGFVYVLNAASFTDIRNAFRDNPISLDYECEIYEIDQNSDFFLP